MIPYPTYEEFLKLEWSEKEGLVACLMRATGDFAWRGEKWRFGGMDRTYGELIKKFKL